MSVAGRSVRENARFCHPQVRRKWGNFGFIKRSCGRDLYARNRFSWWAVVSGGKFSLLLVCVCLSVFTFCLYFHPSTCCFLLFCCCCCCEFSLFYSDKTKPPPTGSDPSFSLFLLKVTFSGGGFRLVAKNSAGIKGLRGRGTVLYPTSSPSIGHCCFDDHLYSLPKILQLVRIKRERSRRLLAEGGIASFLPPSVSPARSLYHY